MQVQKVGSFSAAGRWPGVAKYCSLRLERSPLARKAAHDRAAFVPSLLAGFSPSVKPLGGASRMRSDMMVQSTSDSLAGGGNASTESPKTTLVNGYLIISILYAAMGIAQVAFPQKIMSAAVSGSLAATNEYTVRANGLLSLLMALFIDNMREAASNDALDSATYKRIGWWAALHSVLSFAVVLSSPVKITTAALAAKACLPLALISLYWKAYGNIPLLQMIPNAVSVVKDTFSPSNAKAGIFSVLTVLVLAKAVVLVMFPNHMWKTFLDMSLDDVGIALNRAAGLGLGSFAVATYSLKDAADRGKLGSSPFRTMNLAIILMILTGSIIVGVFYPSLLQPYLDRPAVLFPTMLVNLLMVVFLGYLYFTEKE